MTFKEFFESSGLTYYAAGTISGLHHTSIMRACNKQINPRFKHRFSWVKLLEAVNTIRLKKGLAQVWPSQLGWKHITNEVAADLGMQIEQPVQYSTYKMPKVYTKKTLDRILYNKRTDTSDEPPREFWKKFSELQKEWREEMGRTRPPL